MLVAEAGLGGAGEEQIRSAFKRIDTNENGQLDLSEAMMGVQKIREIVGKHTGGGDGGDEPADEEPAE